MVRQSISERGTPMDPLGTTLGEAESISGFAQVMRQDDTIQPRAQGGTPCRARLELDPEKVRNGLGQLVLTVIKLLHELLERQAIRRIDAGSLTEEKIERLGITLMGPAGKKDRLGRGVGL